MKAAILETLNTPLTIAEVQPGNLGFGQVLVRVLVSGICGAQLQEIAGHKGNASHLPHLLGHEGCGIVERVGVGVSLVVPGEKVVMHWRKGSGIESELPKYNYAGREIRSGRVTTFSEQAICSENRLTVVPHETPNELCALLGCGLSTALGTIERDANLQFGESVLIVGCGGLGMNLIRAATMRRASPIAVVESNAKKRHIAYEMGADVFFTDTNLDADGGFDVIIDTVGDSLTSSNAMRLLAPSGRYVMLGQPRPGASIEILDARHMFEGEGKVIRATQGGGFNPSYDVPRYVKLYRAGLLNLKNIITSRVSLDNINEGIDLVRAGMAGRIMVEIASE